MWAVLAIGALSEKRSGSLRHARLLDIPALAGSTRFVDDIEPTHGKYQPSGRMAPRYDVHEVGGWYKLRPNVAVPAAAFPTAFPNQGLYPPKEPPPVGVIECLNAPNWKDKRGQTCDQYVALDLCTPDKKQGPKWDASWGTIEEAGSPGGLVACCECGGGVRRTVLGPPLPTTEERTLHPYSDRFPLESYHYAREPRIHNDPKIMAPADKMPVNVVRYLEQFRRRADDFTPSGLSAQFYEKAPDDWSGDWGQAPVSQLVNFIYYTNVLNRLLRWPGQGRPRPWYVRWTGTLTIVQAGQYELNLVLTSKAKSRVRIGPNELVTKGQCASRKQKDECDFTGCEWVTDKCVPKSDVPLQLDAKGYCVEIVVEVNDAAQLVRLEYKGNDSGNVWATVPTIVLSCDPTIIACYNPRENACTTNQ
eukprot:GEMP01059422.1.p1 GENE.GEMP01059422.1~~GEMP01059422.1.p1  ORF type:complete len:419 (+),score=86.19 GEMP01059422.1:134-1390(+)